VVCLLQKTEIRRADMAKAVYINSYAQAERLGIKPFDSLIGTVAIPTRKPRIVAFRGSHSTSVKDRGKYTMSKISRYVDNRGESFYASSKPMLDILLRALFTRKPPVRKMMYH
jgi:hypothetical protein